MMRLMLAATIATGLALAPAALAKDAAKSGTAKHKTHRAGKAHKAARGALAPTSPTKPGAHPYGEPYTMQKDEMTR